MGQILSQPVTEKHSERDGNGRLIYGISSMQGWRLSMEDAHSAVLDLQSSPSTAKSPNSNTTPASAKSPISFFGVFDGHGGDKVAIFTGENIHKIIAEQETFKNGDLAQSLKDGFLSADRAILQDPVVKNDPSGCTATSAFVTDKEIICGNAGDSRTVLGIKGIAKALSFDHKPQNEGERARICAAGGFVEAGRVNGNLALSRAIGDFDFKRSADLAPEEQVVTAFPEVIQHDLTPDDEFLILACDGIWDCMTSQSCVEYVRRGIGQGLELETICENLMDSCLAPSSDVLGVGCDNMTVLIVGLLQGKTKQEWYKMIANRINNGDGPVAPEDITEVHFSNHNEEDDEEHEEEREDEDEEDEDDRDEEGEDNSKEKDTENEKGMDGSVIRTPAKDLDDTHISTLQHLLGSNANVYRDNGYVVIEADNASELLETAGLQSAEAAVKANKRDAEAAEANDN
ncbi:PP2C-domain-containing protein [Nadsonia fulvescens var. elongata DSM 6958]|uniref:protein-serine/threonine phosphatase n=1 Tax=Nadsonia fulvescens var. elongata DSM 6958 TaxID=857566 RepID=A0A1E3PQ23_9ASCO|nr:PP2C-domain-containing protein [Nadsonia fulvescens var. elongata DSM 6958]